MSLPRVTITGRLTDDPTVRFTASGAAVVSGRVAADERRKNPQTQEWEQTAQLFLPWSAWRAQAIADELRKGAEVTITGTLVTREWEDKDGGKRSVVEVKDATVARVIRDTPPAQQPAQQGGAGWGSDPW